MKTIAVADNTLTPDLPKNEPVKLGHIDLLRGIAVILVVITHVSLTDTHIGEFTRAKLLFGQTGVQLFFFLSAYTLCLSMSERKETDHIKKFYLRRFFRIAPLYYAGIIVYYIVFKLPILNQHGPLEFYPHFTKKNILLNVLFLHGFNINAYNYVVPGGWSISTEMVFYVIFPFIFSFFTRIKKAANYLWMPLLALVIANIYMGAAYFVYHDQVFTQHFFFAFILNQLPVFIVGITYFFLDRAGLIKIPKYVAVLAFMMLYAASYKLMGFLTYNINFPVFLASISFGFLFSYFKDQQFQLPLLRRIGQLSYSIYICHFLFAYPLASKISSLIGDKVNGYAVFIFNFFITLLLSVITAIITEKLIEKPGIQWGKTLIKKLYPAKA